MPGVQVEYELKDLESIYTIYREHEEAICNWSAQLWADLDVARMATASNERLHALWSLDTMRALPVWVAAEQEVAAFAASLPLMRNLKHEALRRRHWEALMQATGMVKASLLLPRNAISVIHAMQMVICTALLDKAGSASHEEGQHHSRYMGVKHGYDREKSAYGK